MSSQKLEYDSTLGGSVVLPNHVQTFRHAAANINEIKSLLHEIRNPSSTKLVFQTLPKHMRRRAMSHHPNRLPRKYRSIHNSQMAKAGKPPQVTKRPSRKYRRKPSNLLKDYIRRQRNHKWLETHIWHAKRFHMVPKWGYKLPYASCDKTYRACYRASAKHCLLQDISFFGCIEIRAKLVSISDGFSTITSPKCGLGIGAKTYTSGRREGSLELFKSGEYPLHALGKVSFLWRPEETETDAKRTLWLFIHPSAYDEILQELVKVLHLEISKAENNQTEISEDDDTKDTPQLQFMTKSFAYRRAPQYQNDSGSITLTELKDTMSRFRLTGPLSQAVLAQALRVKEFHDSEPENWFKQVMDKIINLKAHLAQADFWKNCQGVNSPGELLSNMVLGLNVEDPRIHRPTKRTKAVPGQAAPNLDVLLNTEQNLHYSSLWSFDLRNTVCRSMMSVHEYCTQREKNSLVPGERCLFEGKMQPVPLLLIQRPGSQDQRFKRLSYSCGWDVIIPSGYGMPVWLSLIMWGAKPGGLRELESVNRELGRDQFLPDSVSGVKESSERQLELRLKYFRKPPNKRCNFNKLAISSPFKAPFSQLVRDWTLAETADYFILRDRDLLKQLNCAINQKKQLPTLPPSCLVQINLCMKTRGNPGDFAIICLPTTADFKRNLKRIKFEKNDPIHTEPLHKDSHENERKKLQTVHKRLLKRLRRRRVREKRRKQETSETCVKIQPANTAVLVMEQFKKMCELWLPESESNKSLRNQCTREVFGYVTRCEFSYIEATVAAVGYITVPGLQELTRIWKRSKGSDKLLLVRGAQSRHYRFASFKINCDV